MDPAVSSEVDPTPDEIRARAHRAISNAVRELGPIVRVDAGKGREILDIVTEVVFTFLFEHGFFRFPSGYGSLKVQRLTPRTPRKRLPTGEIVTLPPHRVRVRYDDGLAVKEVLGTKPKRYARVYRRESKLSKKTRALLDGTI